METPKNHYRTWNEGERLKLKQCAASGGSVRLLAAELGRSVASVRVMASTLGLSLRPKGSSAVKLALKRGAKRKSKIPTEEDLRQALERLEQATAEMSKASRAATKLVRAFVEPASPVTDEEETRE